MENNTEKLEFPKGLFAKKPKEGAPSFVKAKLSIKVTDLIAFLKVQTEEYLNYDLLEKKDGSGLYLKKDEWKPTPKEARPDEINPEDIPF